MPSHILMVYNFTRLQGTCGATCYMHRLTFVPVYSYFSVYCNMKCCALENNTFRLNYVYEGTLYVCS